MAFLETENKRYSNLVKEELWPNKAYCRKVVTARETGATDYVVGTALGIVTATGKYAVSVETASDGSEDVVALVVQDVAVPAATDTNVLVMFRGPAEVSKAAIVLDATFDNDAKKNVVYAALEAAGISVATTV
jgi:hypothetical protein